MSVDGVLLSGWNGKECGDRQGQASVQEQRLGRTYSSQYAEDGGKFIYNLLERNRAVI